MDEYRFSRLKELWCLLFCRDQVRFHKLLMVGVAGGCGVGRVQWAVQPPSTGRMTPVR